MGLPLFRNIPGVLLTQGLCPGLREKTSECRPRSEGVSVLGQQGQRSEQDHGWGDIGKAKVLGVCVCSRTEADSREIRYVGVRVRLSRILCAVVRTSPSSGAVSADSPQARVRPSFVPRRGQGYPPCGLGSIGSCPRPPALATLHRWV